MNQSVAPADIPHDTYPIVRIASEHFLRGIDLLTRVQDDKLISGLIFMTLWHGQMHATDGGPVGIRELARKLTLPYETVRRHAAELVASGQCVATTEGIAVQSAVLRRQSCINVLRKIHLNAERLLVELTRAGLAKFRPSRARPQGLGSLTREQTVIATIATGQILAGARLLGDLWNGDFLRGLVYTAIWTANVKHVTNTAPAISKTVLPDELRLPVSVLAILNSLRLPYETVRRHANSLLKDGICVRAGKRGLVVPASTHRKLAATAVDTNHIIAALLSEVRQAGVKV